MFIVVNVYKLLHMNLISYKKLSLFTVGAMLLFLVSGFAQSVLAQGGSSFTGDDSLSLAVGGVGKGVETFGTLVSVGTTIAVSLAFFFFFWNLFKFIRAGDADSKEEAQGKMVWALVAIIVIVSLWGIIAFVRSVLGIEPGEANDVVVPGTVLNKSRVNEG